MSFTADHNGFYREGRPFYPLIQENDAALMEWANTVVIRLPARLQDDLDWSTQTKRAQECKAVGKQILWEIDLGLGQYQFDPQDSTAFFSFTLALDEFSAKIWPTFRDQTFGVVLYRGIFNPASSFPLSKWEHSYAEWRESQSITEDCYALYCAQNFAEYLHRLISFLPDAVLPFIMLDVSAISSPAKAAQLFSKEHFEHTHLIFKGSPCPFSGITWEEGELAQGWMGNLPQIATEKLPPPLGIYLPKDQMIDASILTQLDGLIASLIREQTPFRIISEEKLTEQWDGLDRLIVPEKAISKQGKRKLLGFVAAGGTVTTV